MLSVLLFGFGALAVGLVYASMAEWVIHRFLMHRPLPGYRHFFVGHAQVHHGIYKADATYLLGDRQPEQLMLAWWAMPIPVAVHVPGLVLVALWFSLPAAVGLFLAFSLYQASYEYLHYCMHVPQNRWFENTSAFRWITEHHREHHRKHSSNLNVVLPFADFLWRTRRRPLAE
jgi:hypothetical protein